MRWDRQNQFVGFVSTYCTLILLSYQMLFVITGFVIAGCHCTTRDIHVNNKSEELFDNTVHLFTVNGL